MAEGESSGFGPKRVDRHQNLVSQKKRPCPLKPSGGPRKKAEQESRPRVKPTGWTCGECLQWFPERDSYVSHVKTSHRKVSLTGHSQREGGGTDRQTDRRVGGGALVEPFPGFSLCTSIMHT